MMESSKKAAATPIGAVTLGGAITTILVWAIDFFAGVGLPPEVVVATTSLVTFVTQRVISKIEG